MARQTYITSQEYETRSAEAIVRLAKRATEIDPAYAQAWALMAIGHGKLRLARGGGSGEGMAAAERALALDPALAEARAVKAQILLLDGDAEAAAAEVAIALEQDPESYEVNRSAGRLNYQLKRYEAAIRYFEKAADLMEADLNSASMLMSAYTVLGDVAGMRRAAQQALKRAEAILVHDQNNSMVAGYSAYALAALGEGERAKARMERALLIDPKQLQHALQLCVCIVRLFEGQERLARHARPGIRLDHGYLPALCEGRPGSRPAARRSALPGHAGGRRGAARGECRKAGDRRELIRRDPD